MQDRIDFLTRQQLLPKVATKDLDVWPLSASEWSIYPNDITSLNAHRYLISIASAIPLVRVVEPVDCFDKRCRFTDCKIDTIDSHLNLLKHNEEMASIYQIITSSIIKTYHS